MATTEPRLMISCSAASISFWRKASASPGDMIRAMKIFPCQRFDPLSA